MSKILIVDSTNNFVRNYVVVPTLDKDGNPIGAVTGFMSSLRFMIERCRPDKVILVWDGAGGSKKRRAIVPEYKEGRKPYRLNRNYDFENIDQEDNKIQQRIKLDEYLRLLPVTQIMIDDIEADDTIACLTRHFADDQKVISSTDKDFLQLLDNKTIIYSPIKRVFVNRHHCKKKYDVYPQNFALVRAIVGDKTDNLKGIRQVGMKRVLEYFPFLKEEKLVTLDELFAHAEANGEKFKKFLDGREVIINNLKLMQLKDSIISFSSIHKIKEAVDQPITFNPTAFRVKLIQDGITDIGDSFFNTFKLLYY